MLPVTETTTQKPLHGSSMSDEEARMPLTSGSIHTPLTEASSSSGEYEVDEHEHFSQRTPWLRAFVLGANDGLVSVGALMLGVGGGVDDLQTMRLSGLAAWVAGALSMAAGEYVSVSSQRDAEEADLAKERREQAKGPAERRHELHELQGIYMERGLPEELALRVAEELTKRDVIRAHARDELGIDIDNMANPLQATLVSATAFTVGALIPLLAGAFVQDHAMRMLAVASASVGGLAVSGALGARLGGARPVMGALRVLVGGCLALAATYGIGRLLGVDAS